MSKKIQVIRTLLAIVLVTTAVNAKAQTQTAKDSLMKIVTKEVCDELSGKDFTGKSMDDLQMEMGMAFMPALMRHKDAIEKELGGGINDEEAMEKMGQEIGMRLVGECPTFLKIMTSAGATKSKVNVEKTNTISGTLVKVVPGEISHLLVKDAKGKVVKVWWMDYFDGSDTIADNPLKAVNKKVAVTYVEKEVYSASLKQYVNIKVANGISWK